MTILLNDLKIYIHIITFKYITCVRLKPWIICNNASKRVCFTGVFYHYVFFCFTYFGYKIFLCDFEKLWKKSSDCPNLLVKYFLLRDIYTPRLPSLAEYRQYSHKLNFSCICEISSLICRTTCLAIMLSWYSCCLNFAEYLLIGGGC